MTNVLPISNLQSPISNLPISNLQSPTSQSLGLSLSPLPPKGRPHLPLAEEHPDNHRYAKERGDHIERQDILTARQLGEQISYQGQTTTQQHCGGDKHTMIRHVEETTTKMRDGDTKKSNR